MRWLSRFFIDKSHAFRSSQIIRPHRTSDYSVPQKRSVLQPLNYMLCGQFHCAGERIHISSWDHLNFQKIGREFVPRTFRNLLCPQKKRGSITPVTLREHNSHNLTPCVGTPPLVPDYLPNIICYFEYLRDRLSTAMPHP